MGTAETPSSLPSPRQALLINKDSISQELQGSLRDLLKATLQPLPTGRAQHLCNRASVCSDAGKMAEVLPAISSACDLDTRKQPSGGPAGIQAMGSGTDHRRAEAG